MLSERAVVSVEHVCEWQSDHTRDCRKKCPTRSQLAEAKEPMPNHPLYRTEGEEFIVENIFKTSRTSDHNTDSQLYISKKYNDT